MKPRRVQPNKSTTKSTTARAVRPPAPDLPLRHPATMLVVAACVASIVLSAGYRLYDTDLWQLLVVGKAIWTERAIPMTDQWAWPSFGEPQVTSSWGFRALLWPLWSNFGVAGLFGYRWLALLLTFGILMAIARRMGARGFTPFVVAALGALAYRLRAEVRPESLAVVLLAATLWVLETRRSGGRDPWFALPILAGVWTNVHVSWYLGVVLIGIYALDEAWRVRRVPWRLIVVGLVSAAASLLNPFGWRALVQPFQFAFVWRHEEMFRNVVELWPVNWSAHRTDGLPLLIVLWPLLLAWRARRQGADLAGIAACAAFTSMGITSQRFLGFYVVVAVPFVARDLSEWVAGRRWPTWTATPGARSALAATACLAIGIPEWSRHELPLGFDLDRSIIPAAAGDFLEANHVRGRAFNHFHLGGYLAWRGWPDRDRLPFATTQPENLRPADRARYPRVFVDPSAWQALDRDYRFDYVVLQRNQDPGDRLLDYLDADSSWTLVFSDDVAQVLVRNDAALADVAARHGYRTLPAGVRRREAMMAAVGVDTALRALAADELRRMARSSTQNSSALHPLAMLLMKDGAWDEAAKHLHEAMSVDPRRGRVREQLGVIALAQGRPAEALVWFERERALGLKLVGVETRIGQTHEALGDPEAARRAYTRELERHPEFAPARAALQRLKNP